MLLLSCIRAEIYVTSYLLPVNGRHLWFPTFPDIEQHPYLFLRILWHGKHVITVENELLTCILSERHVITLFQPPSWISDFRFHLAVLLIAPLKSLTRKHGDIDTRIMFLSRQIAALLKEVQLCNPLDSSRYNFRWVLGGLTWLVIWWF